MIVDWKNWIKTVDSKPAPIQTLLGPLSDLFRDATKSKTAASALQSYFDACPHTSTQGICNGYGYCDFKNHTCNCPSANGVAKGQDNNCYRQCPDNCNNEKGAGTCKNGVCHCNQVHDESAGVRYGFYGTSCQNKCGRHQYNAGTANYWMCGGLTLDVGADIGCYCNNILEGASQFGWPDTEWQGHMDEDSLPFPMTTYNCGESKCAGKQACTWHVRVGPVPFTTCTGVKTFTCTFGDEQCPMPSANDTFSVNVANGSGSLSIGTHKDANVTAN